MANDNTLGAPTEGLGQTVTFAAQRGGGTPQTGSDQRQAVRNNPGQGGARLTAQALQVAPSQPNATFAALMKLGSDIIEPHIKQARTEAYAKGMQRAAQNEAITDIVAEQPWYSKVFGSTSLVDGARAWSASTTATNVAVTLEESMPELRKLSADEFSKHVANTVLKSNIGDAATDALVLHQLSQHLPGVMRAQAKNHLAYQNEMATETLGASQLAAATLLGTRAAKARSARREFVGPLPEGDVAADGAVLDAELRLSGQFSDIPPGMDKLVHQKITAGTVAKALSAGNFAAYDVLDRSGQLDKMEPTLIASLRSHYRAARSEARIKLPLEFAREEADLVAMSVNPTVKPEDLQVATERHNDRYTQLTGDPGRYLDAADLARSMVRLDATYRQEQAQLERETRAATTAADKDAAKVAQVRFTAERLSRGLSVDANEETQQLAWGVLSATNPTTVNFHRVQAAAVGKIDRAHADTLRASISAALGAVSPEDAAKGIIKPEAKPLMFHEAYATMYLPLIQAAGDKQQEVAMEYAGKYENQLAKYHSFFVGRDMSTVSEAEKIVAYEAAVRKDPPKSNPKRIKAITKVLTNNEWFNADQVPSKQPTELAKILAPHGSNDVSPENAVAQAKRKMPDLSIVGGYHWFKPAGSTDIQDYWVQQVKSLPPGADIRGVITGNEHNRAMEHAVKDITERAGLRNATVAQAPDLKGVPQFIIKGEVDGNAVLIGLPAEAITAAWKAKSAHVNLQFGPKLTNLPDTAMPSIYASQDEWAKYREYQAKQKAALPAPN